MKKRWPPSSKLPLHMTHRVLTFIPHLKGVAAGLHDWSTNVLGDLQKRLKKAKEELEKYRRSSISRESVEKEAILCFKVDRIEEQIDVYWKQRAHANWLSKGDRNTSFFTNVARRDEG